MAPRPPRSPPPEHLRSGVKRLSTPHARTQVVPTPASQVRANAPSSATASSRLRTLPPFSVWRPRPARAPAPWVRKWLAGSAPPKGSSLKRPKGSDFRSPDPGSVGVKRGLEHRYAQNFELSSEESLGAGQLAAFRRPEGARNRDLARLLRSAATLVDPGRPGLRNARSEIPIRLFAFESACATSAGPPMTLDIAEISVSLVCSFCYWRQRPEYVGAAEATAARPSAFIA